MLPRGRVHLRVEDAGFNHGQLLHGIDVQDPVHPGQVKDYFPGLRGSSGGKARSGSPGNHRDIVGRGKLHGCHNFFGTGGINDAVGQARRNVAGTVRAYPDPLIQVCGGVSACSQKRC
ncbi:hypothetical protein NicSoilB11_31650 [Arthrobacter sp. NicSoilB11]|nr:hypothetical protein NicSoilB11_31650 [Arthrobacter sp. NicSoilB11]